MEPAATGALPAKLERREPTQVVVLALIGVAGVGVLLVPNYQQLGDALSSRGLELLLWFALILLVNLFFHFENRSLQFTLDVPLLLATSALYAPAVAAGLALVAEMDVREVERKVSAPRALYNRTQIAISVFAASAVFHAVGSVQSDWVTSLLAMSLAWATFHVLNGAFVMALASIRERIPVHHVARFLRVGRPIEFMLTYLGYGILALVLARLFREVGPWTVVLFLIPVLVAHFALVRAEELYAMTEELQERQRLLGVLSRRVVDERRDERLRIAGDLHDEVLQDVTRVWMQSRFASEQCIVDDALSRDVRQLVADSSRALTAIREAISDLKRSPLGRGGLLPTLEQLVRDLKLEWGRRIEFEQPEEGFESWSADTQLVAYQVVRESLINSLKHSHASEIVAHVSSVGPDIEVGVKDDGVGFEPEGVDRSRHFGLGLTQERVRMVGGVLRLQSAPGEGCEVRAVLPRAAKRRTSTQP
jgi:signal transduction histidine kinase